MGKVRGAAVWIAVIITVLIVLTPALNGPPSGRSQRAAAGEVPTATETGVPEDTETPEPTATETLEPIATETVKVTATDTATTEPTATETGIPTQTQTSTPTNTSTATATNTATKTPTRTPTTVPAKITLSTNKAQIGQTVTLSLTGFKPGTRTIKFDSLVIGTATINASGNGTLSYKIPATTGGAHEFSTPFGNTRIRTAITVRPTLTLSVSSVTEGKKVTFSVKGFAASETVRIRLYASTTSSSYVTLGTFTAASDGTGSRTYTIPVGTAARDHKVMATGNTYGAERVLTVKAAPTKTPTPRPTRTATPRPSGCEPGYSPCLPVVGDLDCSDIRELVRVTGSDRYRLDSDNDGWGCESYG